MSFLKFVRLPQPIHRKTPIVRVQTADCATVLGTIKWYGAWRGFVFYPADQTLFDISCLREIANQIDELKRNRHVPSSET